MAEKIASFSRVVPGAKAGVIIVHGIAEHKGRYLDFINRLEAVGISVFAPDLRGHGESFGARGDVEKFQDYLDDLDTFVRRVRAGNPELKLALFGHSMGGLIAAVYAGTESTIDALVLSSPAVERRWYLAILKLLPTWILRRVKIKKYWSESKAMMNAAQTDPLGVMHFTLRLIRESFVVGVARAAATMKNIRVPVLVVGGVGDAMTHDLDGVLATVSSADKTLRIYERAIHRVVQNAAADEAIPDIIAWVNSKTSDAEQGG
ncbi:MAG: lysophospholipase [Alphaproteobacteria bacterium]|nr:lysophospholipase [Alphaproteobacteria bacterium]